MSSIFEEVAFDPAAFESARDVRDVANAFGFAQGRLVSALPANWVRCVYERVGSLPDMESKRVRTLLEKVKYAALVKSGFEYAPHLSWEANAHSALDAARIDGAVASRQSNGSLPSIDKYFESIEPRHECEIQTTVDAYRGVCRRLVERGPRIVIIDRYFHVWKTSGGRDRLLVALLKMGAEAGCHDFDIFLRAKEVAESIDLGNFERNVRQTLESRLPDGTRVEFFVVEELRHDRFLLSEHGGIHVGVGFKVEGIPEPTTVSTLTLEHHRRLCLEFLDRPLAPEIQVKRQLVLKGKRR